MAGGSGIRNLASFTAALGQEQKAIEDAIGLVTRKVALDVLSRVVLATPVDTGRARGNWQVGIGNEPTGVVQTTDKTGGSTTAAGSVEIDKLKQNPFAEINIVNNLPYIERLNAGWSQQAPAGFIENAVDAATRF